MLGPDKILGGLRREEKKLDIDFSTFIIFYSDSNDDLTLCVGEGFVLILILDFLFNFKLEPFMREGDRYPLWNFKNHEVTFRSAFREFNQWPPKRGGKTLIKWSLLSSWTLIILKVVGQFFPSLMSSQSDGREKLRMLSCKPLMFSILAL